MKRSGRAYAKSTVGICLILIALAVVMAPAVTESIESAQKRVCAQNLGILGRAFQLYTADYGRFPFGGNLDGLRDRPYMGDWVWFDGVWAAPGPYLWNNPSYPWTWRMNPSKGSIWRYTDQRKETYICPADAHAINPHVTRVENSYGTFGLSYSMNFNILWAAYGDYGTNQQGKDANGNPIILPARVSDIIKPDQTMLLSEQWSGGTHPAWKNYTTTGPIFDGVFRWWQSVATVRHGGGGNYLMIDGHVQWTKAEDQRSLNVFRAGNPTSPTFFSYPATP